jgi:hypothetical protein
MIAYATVNGETKDLSSLQAHRQGRMGVDGSRPLLWERLRRIRTEVVVQIFELVLLFLIECQFLRQTHSVGLAVYRIRNADSRIAHIVELSVILRAHTGDARPTSTWAAGMHTGRITPSLVGGGSEWFWGVRL